MSKTNTTIAAWKQQLRDQAAQAMKAVKAMTLPKTPAELLRYMRTLVTAEKMIAHFWPDTPRGATSAPADIPTEAELEVMAGEAIEAALAETPILNRQQRRWLERRERKRPAG